VVFRQPKSRSRPPKMVAFQAPKSRSQDVAFREPSSSSIGRKIVGRRSAFQET
jgi:hypothetical protein